MMKEIVQYLKQLDTMDCEIEQTFHPIMPCVTEMMSWSISKIKSKLQAANLHTYGLRADLVCRLHEHMDHTHTKSLGSPVQVTKEMTQEKKEEVNIYEARSHLVQCDVNLTKVVSQKEKEGLNLSQVQDQEEEETPAQWRREEDEVKEVRKRVLAPTRQDYKLRQRSPPTSCLPLVSSSAAPRAGKRYS